MKRPSCLLSFTFLLVFVGIALFTTHANARGVQIYDGTGQRPSSSDGGSFVNGDDVEIRANTNCAWLYLNNNIGPSYWSNNVSILGTGFNSEQGGALRFGQGGTNNTNEMILTGDVTFLGNATIGVQTANPNATGIITGQLKIDSSLLDPKTGALTTAFEFLYRGRYAAATAGTSDQTGILVLTADSDSFIAPIRVGSGTLQLGYISSVTAKGWEWVDDGAGGETYQQNNSKQFVFDGSTGSIASPTINLTSVFDVNNDLPTLKFQRSGEVTVNNAITGNGKVVFDGTATYKLGETGSFDAGLNSVTVNKGATLVNNRHFATTNTWDFDHAVSGDGFYQVGYSDQTDILSANTRTTLYYNDVNPRPISNFTGVYVFSDGYRYNLSADWNTASKGYSLGATDFGQIWVQGTAKYSGDMYLKGTGWSTSEYRGALRFAGNYGDASGLPAVTNMAATYGNIYLMGDTRVTLHADRATVALIASDVKNYGDGDYTLEVANSYNGSTLYFTGTSEVNLNLADATTFQVGHQGTLNGVAYDGTQGSLGTGSVTVGSSAKLRFMRSGDVTLNNEITNSGRIIFDGGGNYTTNAALSGGTVEIADGAKLTTKKAFSATTTGAGTIQINNPNTGSANFPGFSQNNFTGTLLIGSEYRWDPGTNTAYDIGAADNGQLWLLNLADYKQANVYIAGTGWGATERFGAIRFAGGNSNATSMVNITGTTHLLDDASVGARHGDTGVYGMISGNIDGGNYTLTIDSTGKNANSPTGTVILTGTNTYGETKVNAKDTLVIGWIGTVNGKEYDGSTGTLGTGDVTVAQNAKLKFNRSGDVTISNALDGTGSVIFDGTASYTVDPNKLGSTLGSIQVGQNSTLVLAGEISDDVSKRITVADASNPIQVSGSTINVTLSDESTTAPGLTFENDLNFTGSNTINMVFADGFTPMEGETYFLFSGTDNTMNNLDLSSFQTISPELPASMSWFYSIESLGNGMVLAASLGVPEPATWIMLAFGTFFMLLRGVHVRRAR
ncbi:MAG: hypothetical protein Q4A17_04825 [Thermoguttaceae bacterium]|nr:hypothetical protein [Thermoguttaceae bacterium]